MSRDHPRRHHLTAIFQALLVTFLWSTSWILIKVGLQDIPPITFAGLRYVLATGVLAVVLLFRPRGRDTLRRLGGGDWARLALLGVVFYALTQGAQFVALAYLPAVTLSLVLSFSPAAVALLGVPLLGERLARNHWLGLLCFLLGATVYFLPLPASLHALGLAIAVLGMLANAAAGILGRSINRSGDLPPLVVTVVSMAVGSALLLATGLTIEGLPHLDLSAWGIILWLAIVNTALAFTLWNHTLRRLTAVESSLINNTMLIQIAILAWIVLGEGIEPREGVGLALAVLGVLLVQLPGATPRADAAD